MVAVVDGHGQRRPVYVRVGGISAILNVDMQGAFFGGRRSKNEFSSEPLEQDSC